MNLSTMGPYELGETKDKESIPYLIEYLRRGIDNDKRLAASAIKKLIKLYPTECAAAFPSLMHNLSSNKPQVRQYSLNAIQSLPIKYLPISENDIAIVKGIESQDEKEYNRSVAQNILRNWEGEARVEEKPMRIIDDIHFPKGATRKVIELAKMTNNLSTIELVANDENDAFYFRSLEENGIKLNEPQLSATRHYHGPALVLAGAGSGKTRVLTSRAGYLISVHHVNPKQILLLTFTKKAAEEIKERISLLPGISKSIARNVTSGTYHSIFLRLLRAQGEQRNIISNEKHKQVILKKITKQMDLNEEYEPEELLALLSHYKNNMQSVESIPADSPIEKEIKQILIAYEEKKKEYGYMDFDDILLLSYHLLKQNDSVLKGLQRQFSFVLCDEWQDTNPIQYELIKMIAKPQNNLFVVGDDDQTIYEFSGADSSIILNFSHHYPSVKTYKLEINYRSTKSIVGLANKVISFNKKRYKKTLSVVKENDINPYYLRPEDTNEEAEYIVENIINDVQQGVRKFLDFAILFRSSSNSRAVFDQLVLKDIPFVTYGESYTFYEHTIVKPVIDHLRLAMDNTDVESIEGILPTLYLNREKTMDFLMRKVIVDSKRTPLLHLLDLPNIKDYQKKQIFNRVKLIQNLKRMSPLKAVQQIRKHYDKYLEADERKNLTLHKEMIKDTLSEIESSARQFESIEVFIDFVNNIIQKNKEMEKIRKNPKADVVKLMTIHKSKGLEFPVVYLIGASETILPHSSALNAGTSKDIILKNKEKFSAAIESERRLAYVAITRAKDELYISSPCKYRDKKVGVSRFIKDVFTEVKTIKKVPDYKSKTIRTTKKPPTKPTQKQSILVWECTNDTCIAWKRITNYDETLLESIDCPICKGTMKQSIKEV